MKRVVISDLHVGSKFYKSKEILEFLKTEDFDELILAGDIIDFIKILQIIFEREQSGWNSAQSL